MAKEFSNDEERAIVKLAQETAALFDRFCNKIVKIEYYNTESYIFGSCNGLLTSSNTIIRKDKTSYPLYVWIALGDNGNALTLDLDLDSKISIEEITNVPFHY